MPNCRPSTFVELLDDVGILAPASVAATALVQPHCHRQAVLGASPDRRVLERNGITVATNLAGCCGLAGNLGAERGHGEMSRAVTGLDLSPALARATPDEMVLADGFSYRTQISFLSGLHALHLAEVLADRSPLQEPA